MSHATVQTNYIWDQLAHTKPNHFLIPSKTQQPCRCTLDKCGEGMESTTDSKTSAESSFLLYLSPALTNSHPRLRQIRIQPSWRNQGRAPCSNPTPSSS
jgi:hypothetical protein